MFRKMPFILLAAMIVAVLSNSLIPLSYKSALYGLSLSLKSLIIFALPFLIFGLLFKTAVQISKNATKTILFLLVAICASNFLSTLLSYTVGSFAYGLDLSMTFPKDIASLNPAWTFELPKLIGNGQAMFAGLLLGILLGKFKPVWAEKISIKIEAVISVMMKALLYVIPIFIIGFVVKLSHEGVISHIVRNYTVIFGLVACAVFSYIALLYLGANRFRFLPFVQCLKNMLPAAIAGFGSMSSAAAMPLTILGTEKNAQDPDLAKAVIPATVNVHLIGDCFAIPIFAFAILKNFGIAEPAFASYLVFAAFFVLAKFSVAAVPGGGILVMLPILESYLGFNAEMLSLITALYILFDPVITCANVLGNGGFALAISKMFTRKTISTY